MFKKILHGNDSSEHSFKALAEAIGLAKLYGAELHSISVEEISHCPETIGEIIEDKEEQNGKFRKDIERGREMAKREGVELHAHVVIGHEVKTIIEFVKSNKFDLLVIGFMGRSAIYDRIMGSTCQSLVRLAPCNILIVK